MEDGNYVITAISADTIKEFKWNYAILAIASDIDLVFQMNL